MHRRLGLSWGKASFILAYVGNLTDRDQITVLHWMSSREVLWAFYDPKTSLLLRKTP